MADILENVLIEGFDPEQFKDENVDYSDKDWEKVYAAYQNDKFLEAPITGIETIGEGENKKTCAIMHVGKIKGIIPLEYTGRSEETRLNSSHVAISYAVFCLKKKNKTTW